jgi:hypothetical protein
VRLNTAILAHVLPKIALVFVAAELHAFEVAAGNDAQDLAGPDQWTVAQAAIPHQAQRVDRRLIGRRRISAFRQDPADRIAPGEDPNQPATVARHQNGSGLAAARIRSHAAITLAVSFMMRACCSRMTSQSFRMMFQQV